MPRRIPDYPDAFLGWNWVASFGSYVTTIGILLFIYILYEIAFHGEPVGKNVWENVNERTAERGFRGPFTLEWMIDSPPHFHTFEELPQIRDVKNGAAFDFVRKNPGAFPLATVS